MGGDSLQRLTALQTTGLGALAGVCSKMVNYPLLVAKNSSQQNIAVPWTNPKLVYRGLPVACANLGGTTAIQFFATGFFQKILATKGRAMSDGQKVTAAFLGGLASGVPNSLWELTMIQQQRFGGSVGACYSRLIKQHGASSLFRGMTTTLGREGMFTMAMLGITPAIQENLVTRFGWDANLGLAIGALTGSLLSATATHPLDTIKVSFLNNLKHLLRSRFVAPPFCLYQTCMQGDIERVKYTTVRASGKNLVAEYGVVGVTNPF